MSKFLSSIQYSSKHVAPLIIDAFTTKYGLRVGALQERITDALIPVLQARSKLRCERATSERVDLKVGYLSVQFSNKF